MLAHAAAGCTAARVRPVRGPGVGGPGARRDGRPLHEHDDVVQCEQEWRESARVLLRSRWAPLAGAGRVAGDARCKGRGAGPQLWVHERRAGHVFEAAGVAAVPTGALRGWQAPDGVLSHTYRWGAGTGLHGLRVQDCAGWVPYVRGGGRARGAATVHGVPMHAVPRGGARRGVDARGPCPARPRIAVPQAVPGAGPGEVHTRASAHRPVCQLRLGPRAGQRRRRGECAEHPVEPAHLLGRGAEPRADRRRRGGGKGACGQRCTMPSTQPDALCRRGTTCSRCLCTAPSARRTRCSRW